MSRLGGSTHGGDPGMRACRGFSIVEMVVVSAIVAILAAVAIPVYTGYLKGQRQQAVGSLASSAAVAANAYYRRFNANPDSSKLGLFLPIPGKYKISVSGANVTVKDGSDTTIAKTLAYR